MQGEDWSEEIQTICIMYKYIFIKMARQNLIIDHASSRSGKSVYQKKFIYKMEQALFLVREYEILSYPIPPEPTLTSSSTQPIKVSFFRPNSWGESQPRHFFSFGIFVIFSLFIGHRQKKVGAEKWSPTPTPTPTPTTTPTHSYVSFTKRGFENWAENKEIFSQPRVKTRFYFLV